jgi:mRNA-degrading endonuclease RelE of RelBE toxin-antitoxin system
MKYNIRLTETFLEEIDEICEYISTKLKAIDAANRLREKIIYNVLLLENSPKMFTEIEKTEKTARKYRRIVVNNYVILYTIDESKNMIYVSHVYYGGMDYMSDLNK